MKVSVESRTGNFTRSIGAVAFMLAIMLLGAHFFGSSPFAYYVGWALSAAASMIAARIAPNPFGLAVRLRWNDTKNRI